MMLKQIKQEVAQLQKTKLTEVVREEYKRDVKGLKLLNLFNFFNINKNQEELKYVTSYEVSPREIAGIDANVMARNLSNDLKKMTVTEYIRPNNEKLSFQGMAGELIFSLKLWFDYQFINTKLKEDFTCRSPQASSIFVDNEGQDFIFKYKNEQINFDVKTCFMDAKNVNINFDSYNSFLEQNADFYLICFLDTCPVNYRDIKKAHFILLPKEYFQKNAVLHEKNPLKRSYSKHYKIDAKPFLELIKSQ